MSNLYVVAGPQKGKVFELREGANYIGRSSKDVQIEDPTVSREHLKIALRGGRYYLTDLKSRNRTFFNGSYLAPSLELEVKEGVPIAIGMTVLCIGYGCPEEMSSFLDSIGPSSETGSESGIYQVHKERTNQKKLELLYRVSDVLGENLSVRETCKKVLSHVFALLKNIDRGIFILIDQASRAITETISEPEILGDKTMSYLRDIVERVMADGKPLVISDAQTEKDDLADTLKLLKVESVMCLPMSTQSEIVGFLYIDSLKRPYGFRFEDVALLMDVSQRVADAIHYAQIAAGQSTGVDNGASARDQT
jgi:sigma-B regulation protein RsbU (phosphoserine phosphatase)